MSGKTSRLLFVLLFLGLVLPAYALRCFDQTSSEIYTQIRTPKERSITLKLPIEQATDEVDLSLTESALADEGELTPSELKAVIAKAKAKGDNRAYLDSWRPQWPVKVTGDEGWVPRDQAAKLKQMLDHLHANELERGSRTGQQVEP